MDWGCCKMLCTMHTSKPLLKEMEERQSRLVDCDYSKVDVKKMVSELSISKESKKHLQTTLENVLELFSGCLGKLKEVKLAYITLMSSAKPYSSLYYNILKSKDQAAKTKVD